MFVVRKELEQTLPKTACPGHAVVGKVCLVTSPKTVFVCIWLLVIVCSSFARSLGWPCPRQHAKGMSSRVRCSEIPNLVCSSERSWFLANSVSDVYRCSTHVEQEKGCPYPALATPQLSIYIRTVHIYDTQIMRDRFDGDVPNFSLTYCLCDAKLYMRYNFWGVII